MNLLLNPAPGFISMFGRMADPLVEAPPAPSVVRKLRNGQTWAVQHPKGCRIECLEGRLWVSQESDAGDFGMAPGTTYDVQHDRSVTVLAMGPACVRLAARQPV